MNEAITTTTEHAAPVLPAPAPEPPSPGAVLRAELAALLAADLQRRCPDTPERLIAAVAESAAALAQLARMLHRDCDPVVPRLLLNGIAGLSHGLVLLGTSRIAGSAAEGILIAALERQDTALAMLPPAGRA